MGWFSDFVSDPIGTIGETGQKVIDTAKENPLAAAALIGAGYYFAPQLGAWMNPATGASIAGTEAGAIAGATELTAQQTLEMIAAEQAGNMTAAETLAAIQAEQAAAAAGASGLAGTAATGAAGALGASELAKLGLVSGGANLLGGLLQGSTSKNASNQLATQQAALADKTLGMGKFQPVGTTTRFGTSSFSVDKDTGAITPTYTPTAETKAYQDALAGLATKGITAGQGLMSLGQSYIGESPEAVRQRYMDTQRALLAPGQEQQLAGIRNRLFQTGRGGLATGATEAGNLAATNPELAAYYNSLANTERQLAANAETQYQNQVNFGTGLLGQATTPFTNVFGAQKSVELAAQQPLELSTNFANTVATRGAAQGANYAQAMAPSLQAQYNANNYNPWATALQGAGSNPLTGYGLLKLTGLG